MRYPNDGWMSISMLRSIAPTSRVSSGTRPNTPQNHAAAAFRSATASPAWSSRAVISAMDVQSLRVGRQVGREPAVRVARGPDLGQPPVRLVRDEPVLPPGEVGVADVDAGAVRGGQRAHPAVNPVLVPGVVGGVGVDRVRGQVYVRLHRERHIRKIAPGVPPIPDGKGVLGVQLA